MATFAGEVEVTVTPDTSGFGQRLEAEVLPAATRAAQKIGQLMGATIGRLVSDGVKDGIDGTVARAEIAGAKAGRKYGKEFAKVAKAEIRAGLDDHTVKVNVAVDSASLTQLKEKIASISDKSVTINVNVTQALANVERLRERLQQIRDRVGTTVTVRLAGVAEATAELNRLRLQLLGLRDRTVNVGVRGAGGAGRSVGMLVAAILTLAPALIPIAAAGAGAMAGIALGAMAAAGAVGVLLLALWPVIQAVAAVTQAQNKQANTAATAAARTAQLANASDALKAAQDGVAEAVRTGRREVEQATRAIDRARRTEREAAEDVLKAEQRLADARAEWAGDQIDLRDRILQGALDERQAVLDLKRAEEELRRIKLDPKATAAEREQAEITYLQALKHLQDIQAANGALAEEQSKSAKDGVEGSKKVQDAQKGVTDAKLRQKDAEQEVRDAVAEAAEAQRQAARSVAEAQQQVIQAQRALQQASTSAGMAGSSAMQTMQQKMAALTPEGRSFVLFLAGPMKKALSGLSDEAQRGFLPGMQSGMEAILPKLPGFTGFVGGLAKTMGDLADESGRALAGPWWQQFFGFINQTANPVLKMMGSTIGNLITGLAGLFQAMAPAGMDFGKGLLDASKAFADFGKNAGTNKGFQEFLATVRRDGPIVVDAIKQFVAALGNVSRALEPFGAGLLSGFTSALKAIADANPATIQAVAAAIGLIVVAIKAVTVAQWAWNEASLANPIGLIVAAVIVAIGVIVAWGFALKKLYEENETFRTVVNSVWDAVKTAVSWVWSNVLKPAFEWIVNFVMTKLVPAFMKYLWPAIQFVWQAIMVAIQFAWSVIQVVFKVIEWYVRNVLGPVFHWLYDNVIKPVWENAIKPVFQALADFIGAYIVPAFKAGVAAIGAAWRMVADVAKTPVEFIVNTVINKGIIGTWNKIAGWFDVAPVDTLTLPWQKGPSKPGGPTPSMATGGPVVGAGTGTSDSIPAWLSNGEFVLRAAAVKRLGLRFLQSLNMADRLDISGDPSAFRVGRFAEGGVADSGRVNATKAWLPSTDPLPYVWGGVGPNGYDCSGLSGEVYSRVTGGRSYRRVFTTLSLLANPGRFGLKAGRGALTFGVSDTHMDGNLAGLGFEARGRNAGILIGSGAKPTSAFPHEFFLADLGGSHDEAGGIGIDPLHPIESVKRLLAAVLAPLSKITGTAWGRLLAGLPRKAVDAVVQKASDLWNAKQALRSLLPRYADGGLVGRPTLFDQGGWLQPGLTTVLNASKTPEPVLTGQQWDRLSQGGLVDSRPNLTVNAYNPAPETQSESTTRMMRRLGYSRAGA